MSKRTYKVGFDAGNSNADLVINRGSARRSLSIPSFIGAGRLKELTRIRAGGARGQGGLQANEYVLEQGHASSFVGELALAQSADPESQRGNPSRYWNGHTLNLLKVLAGALIPEKRFTLQVATGLPVQLWSEEAAERVAASLNGVHVFTLNGEEREMTVDGVVTAMEGAGALFTHGSGDDEPECVLDIGGETSDAFYAIGQEPMMQRCAGIGRGVEAIGDLLREELRGRRDLSVGEVRQILHAHAAGGPLPALSAGGKPLALNGEVTAAVQQVGEGITSWVSRLWRSGDSGLVAAEARTALLIGRGAYYFADQIKAVIPHIKVPRNPHLANAEGYCDLAYVMEDDAWYR